MGEQQLITHRIQIFTDKLYTAGKSARFVSDTSDNAVLPGGLEVVGAVLAVHQLAEAAAEMSSDLNAKVIIPINQSATIFISLTVGRHQYKGNLYTLMPKKRKQNHQLPSL